jgi:hypothetical protein
LWLGLENTVTEWLGKLILRAKTKYFFGKIMLPEFTCGKLILPGDPQSTTLCFPSRFFENGTTD